MSWPSAPLGSVATLERDGENPSALHSETRYVGLEHIDGDGIIASAATVGTAELKSTKFRFCEDHILYGKLRPYLRKIARPGFAGVCSTDIIPIRPSTAMDRGYLFHFLRTPKMVDLATSRCTGANLPRLNPSQLEAFEIPLPPLPEQKRIATILDAADTLRAKQRESIEQLDSLIQATFLEMFGDPVTNPKGWEREPVSQLGRVITGNTPSRTRLDYYGEAIEWIKSDNISDGSFVLSKASEGLSADGKKVGRIAPKGSILVTCIAGSAACIGNAGVADRDVAFNQQINAFVPGPRVALWFAFGQLLVGKRLVQMASTNSMTRMVSKTAFMNIEMILPPLPLQARFASIVESIEQQKARLKAHLAELDTLFASLQSRAFNGELVA